MSVILALWLVVGVAVGLAPLLIIVVCALRRAGRKIDQIIEEECAPRPDGNSSASSGDLPARKSNSQE